MTSLSPSSPLHSSELALYTEPAIFSTRDARGAAYPYARVRALSIYDANGVQHLGERTATDTDPRRLIVGRFVADRLRIAFQRILNEDEMNCHDFARVMGGLCVGSSPPRSSVDGLESVSTMGVPTMGLIGAPGFDGIAHSVGYGLGPDGLQVMSRGGELGIANNAAVLKYHQAVFENYDLALYQLPLQLSLLGE